MRNVIFDIGGVILNWNTSEIIDSFAQIIFDEPTARHEYATMLRRDVFDHSDWLATDAGTLTVADATERFAERTNRPLSEMQRLWEHSSESLTLREDTFALMKSLDQQGIPLYCLSNMPAERFEDLERHFDFWSMFQGIVISGAIKMMKPNAEIFEYLLSKYDLAAEDCVFLDDTEKNVIGAKAVGMEAIHFTDAADCRVKLDAWLAE